MSALNTPTCKLSKFLVPILKPLTTNEFTVKDFFIFLKKRKSTPYFFMVSLDVDSLFTNTPLEETIKIYTNGFLKESEPAEDFSKSEFK